MTPPHDYTNACILFPGRIWSRYQERTPISNIASVCHLMAHSQEPQHMIQSARALCRNSVGGATQEDKCSHHNFKTSFTDVPLQGHKVSQSTKQPCSSAEQSPQRWRRNHQTVIVNIPESDRSNVKQSDGRVIVKSSTSHT